MKEKKQFLGQNEGEKVLYVLGRHGFTLLGEIILPLIFLLLSVVGMVMFFYNYQFFLIGFVFFLFFSAWTFYAYFVWTHDRYIVTDQRIVDIEQKGIFSRSQKEATLDKIQDITVEIKGFWGTVFRYGTVIVQTASESSLTLDDVGSPEKVQQTISGLVKENHNKSNQKESVLQQLADIIKGKVDDSKADEGFDQ